MSDLAKICKTCKQKKPLSGFWANPKARDRKMVHCIECAKEIHRQWYMENKKRVQEQARIYHWANREKRLAYLRNWQKENKERFADCKREYQREYCNRNREKKREWSRKATRKRFETSEKYRISQRMSASIRMALKKRRAYKSGSHWEELVGYTFSQLAERLRSTLPAGYTWQDFLDAKLQIDHIIPISAFNFDSAEQFDFKRCWALSNLRLIPSGENARKQAKLDKPFQPSLRI